MRVRTALVLLLAFVLVHAADRPTVAVLEMDAEGVPASEARTLTNKLRNRLVRSGAYTLVERGRMESKH